MEDYSAIKRRKLLMHKTTWMSSENITWRTRPVAHACNPRNVGGISRRIVV
jgi:hypothetical protein